MTTGKTLRNFSVQCLGVGVYLLIGHFRVDLCGLYLTMAEHPADRFKGDPMRECDFRCVCMPSCMEDQRTVNVADSGNLFQVEVQRGIAIHRQQLVTGSCTAIFLQNLQR